MTGSNKTRINNTVKQKETMMEQVELLTEDNNVILVETVENGDAIATQEFINLLESID